MLVALVPFTPVCLRCSFRLAVCDSLWLSWSCAMWLTLWLVSMLVVFARSGTGELHLVPLSAGYGSGCLCMLLAQACAMSTA